MCFSHMATFLAVDKADSEVYTSKSSKSNANFSIFKINLTFSAITIPKNLQLIINSKHISKMQYTTLSKIAIYQQLTIAIKTYFFNTTTLFLIYKN